MAKRTATPVQSEVMEDLTVVEDSVSSVQPSPSIIRVLNQMENGMVFPRFGANNVALPPRRIGSKMVVEIPAAEWEEYKTLTIIQYCLDTGRLVEAGSMNAPLTEEFHPTDGLIIPEHLQTEAELQNSNTTDGAPLNVSAKVVQEKASGSVTV